MYQVSVDCSVRSLHWWTIHRVHLLEHRHLFFYGIGVVGFYCDSVRLFSILDFMLIQGLLLCQSLLMSQHLDSRFIVVQRLAVNLADGQNLQCHAYNFWGFLALEKVDYHWLSKGLTASAKWRSGAV